MLKITQCFEKVVYFFVLWFAFLIYLCLVQLLFKNFFEFYWDYFLFRNALANFLINVICRLLLWTAMLLEGLIQLFQSHDLPEVLLTWLLAHQTLVSIVTIYLDPPVCHRSYLRIRSQGPYHIMLLIAGIFCIKWSEIWSFLLLLHLGGFLQKPCITQFSENFFYFLTSYDDVCLCCNSFIFNFFTLFQHFLELETILCQVQGRMYHCLTP